MKSVIMPSKCVIPIMRGQRSGAIINISSIAAVCAVGILAYKTSKAGVNAITHQMALGNAKHVFGGELHYARFDGYAHGH